MIQIDNAFQEVIVFAFTSVFVVPVLEVIVNTILIVTTSILCLCQRGSTPLVAILLLLATAAIELSGPEEADHGVEPPDELHGSRRDRRHRPNATLVLDEARVVGPDVEDERVQGAVGVHDQNSDDDEPHVLDRPPAQVYLALTR